MELTEKFLISIGGWDVMKRARGLKAAGGVRAPVWEPPVLKGRIVADGREFQAGLKIRNPIDIENLCPCRDSRGRGIICAHSVAVGLEYLSPGSPSPDVARKPAGVARPARVETTEVPRIEFSIEGSLRHLEGELEFLYSGEGRVNPEAETAALLELARMGFEDSKGKAVLRGEEAVVRFFAVGLPRLRKQWSVREGERFRHVTRDIVPIEPHFAIKERGDGWLDFHVHFTAGRDAMFRAQDIQRLLAGGDPRVRLSDGRIAVPDAAMLEDFEEVLRDCDPRQERGGYRVREMHRAGLEAAIGDWTNRPPFEREREGEEVLPESLRGRLRGYQSEGALWMRGLALRKAGGLLADEMGLGKTIQTLAMAASLPGPHLVVCPSPLVWNWEREARRFCPGMRVLVLQGAAREARFSEISAHDLVITSYALLRRDIERYNGIRFTTAILDEAQHIKNPESQNAAAAAALEAEARFILTGTPLENSLRDLWSLFHFLLPGYLGSKRDFKERYEDPLQAGEAPQVWHRLLRRVRPWILRRTKSEVASDLPEHLEQTIEIDLTSDQRVAYTELQIAARAGLDDLKGTSGAAARMRVLTALLRLRQACCDVRLLGAESAEPSGKLDALLEILREAVDGGHRTLVFSQFTSMLDLISPALEEAGITWCRLDGSTRDRQAVVDAFQAAGGPSVFLISLKAGGAGLNLTAADTVVHFDPWWNPAVEAQATARAHRIGQKSTVTSIKLVARDTVEHRVLEMQSKKRALLGGLLEAAEPSPAAFDDGILRELIG